MTLLSHRLARLALCAALAAFPALAIVAPAPLYAQSSASLTGTVLDPRGVPLPGAAVTVRSESGATQKTTSDAQGKYAFSNLPAGKYTIQVDASGFATAQTPVQLAAGAPTDVPVKLALGNVSEEITVEASEANSVAGELAPMDALLAETSARTEITQAMISNFMSPVADYGEAVQMAPSTFTLSSDGVGLGQSKTYFRGFPDGDYDIDFDGIPFYDTNSPTHHSWAFFPTQWLGGIDFDRSPGTASTIGPTPFGGSIHLLSKSFDPVQDIRGQFSYGSYNTFLYDGQYDSGSFGPGKKFNVMVDVHHLQSNGYQTFNYQTYNAGDIQVQYKLSDHTTLTGFSGVIWVDANTPNINATRCQMYGAQSGYTCTGSLLPYAGSGLNFLMVNNADPLNYFDYQYNYYHVPTDFEYVGVHSEWGKGWTLDIKPYTYNYDNSEKYSNAVLLSDTAPVGTTDPNLPGLIITVPGSSSSTTNPLCNQQFTKKGVTAEPCGVDKYNSYRKYGETSTLSQVSHAGIFRAGMWYEWANTNRHQYPSDPLNHWADQNLPNFAEKFVTNSYQPYAEFQWNALPKLQITPGIKWAYYTIGTQQFADDGKTIGCLVAGCVYTYNTQTNINPQAFAANQGSYLATLPSLNLNYRIQPNWSVFAQAAQGSIVPPSSVFDYAQTNSNGIAPQVTLPKQQKNTTYEAGTVLKLKNVTFDADYFHIHFDNSYSCIANNNSSGDDNVCYPQPSSVTQGLEAESNINLSHGLGLYLNGSLNKAVYEGTLATTCTGSSTACAAAGPYIETVPPDIYVQQTPHDMETAGVTYQHRSFDLGFFNKRIGTFYIDNGAYHNQATIAPFDFANLFLNYTIRSGGRFDQTKLRLSFNNLFNSSAITGETIAGTATPQVITENGTTYADAFNTTGPTPINGGDNITIMPARSITVSVIFGFSPKR
ncbi:MAG: TonB-dependent receptor [Acidobacteriaceae bacterium]|jgi:iron complex outermembrane receptor protein